MTMETKPIKNTGQINGHEGANWKITRKGKLENYQEGQRGQICQGGQKIAQGYCPFCPIAIVRPSVSCSEISEFKNPLWGMV